ncbi:hypothetical protein Aasi_1413 [Candidatus Amoebophilus asiaticus 5a2]|uniref:Uncharacterized protein n=1 Tax=Amoebophilus asiaticus (strain 5a2) TaxID=452471 RepID=B3EU04_AMOA5|nr:hypothetical protein [Candidatus Amoebophilus asiaticus]ACE06706.1 hypothetical protein Aasi_1413 [Candidatus Amoebophilus asiaticus 5a2]
MYSAPIILIPFSQLLMSFGNFNITIQEEVSKENTKTEQVVTLSTELIDSTTEVSFSKECKASEIINIPSSLIFDKSLRGDQELAYTPLVLQSTEPVRLAFSYPLLY